MENERIIIETDGDLEAVASVTATVNANGELVVEHDFEDYEDASEFSTPCEVMNATIPPSRTASSPFRKK